MAVLFKVASMVEMGARTFLGRGFFMFVFLFFESKYLGLVFRVFEGS